ncbi:MAG: NAD(P)-dependent oxidoreductase [Proteobacteria bacterium]|nr:NAD(P)-dependent oxidoreductase [Pseudomonadota bacterium]
MAKTVVIGSGGRLGAALVRAWRALGEDVVGLDRAALSLGTDGKVESVLNEIQFDVLVNCAALTNVDYCETHPEEAFKINGEAANDIALHCEDRGARCIHISTDYVFDGNTSKPYTETDTPAPISVYGASKRMGEEAVLSAGSRHWVARVSWVFGPDRVATPTYTLDSATLLRPFLRRVDGGGILHLSNTGVCTWQEYGQWALDCAKEAGLPLKTSTVGGVPMSSIKAFIAKRPIYTAMETGKLASLTRLQPRTWKEAVRAHVCDQVQRGFWNKSNGPS